MYILYTLSLSNETIVTFKRLVFYALSDVSVYSSQFFFLIILNHSWAIYHKQLLGSGLQTSQEFANYFSKFGMPIFIGHFQTKSSCSDFSGSSHPSRTKLML